MSWQSSVRSLLRDLRRSKASTPGELHLRRLHVEAYDSNGEIPWDNIDIVGNTIGGEEGRAVTFFMNLTLQSRWATPGGCSDYVSGTLVDWITALSQQALEKIQLDRKRKLRIENDVYSYGVSAELILSRPPKDTAVTVPYKVAEAIPFLLVLIREGCRPDSSLTTAELYFVLAMASKHCRLLDMGPLNLRLLIIYSYWVQVLDVTTTVPYIASIIDGESAIVDKLIIYQSPWYNFLDPSGQLRVLLSTFAGIRLGPKPEPKAAVTTQMPLQESTINAPRQRSKHTLDDKEEVENKRLKPQGGFHRL